MIITEEILVNITPQETRVAIVENGALQEVSIERQRSRGIVGNIYKGRVNRVLPGMEAAFIDIGLEKAGFLHVSDIDHIDESTNGDEAGTRVAINELLHEGKNLLVATHNAYQSPQDFVYYAMLVFEQFGLSPDSQQVNLCGNIHQDSELYQQLFRYVRNIHYMRAPGFLQNGPKTKALPGYQYFDLFSSLLLN